MRTVRIYLLLVGGPLLGVIVVLHLGSSLQTQTCVAGMWNIEANFSGFESSPCAKLLTTIKQPALRIRQSGTQLLLRLNNDEQTTITGRLWGTNLIAGIPFAERTTAELSCSGSNAVYLSAEVHKEMSEPLQLSGQLRIAGCQGCSSLTFKAKREATVKTIDMRD